MVAMLPCWPIIRTKCIFLFFCQFLKNPGNPSKLLKVVKLPCGFIESFQVK